MRSRTMRERMISIFMAAVMMTGLPAQALGEGEIVYTDDAPVLAGSEMAGGMTGDIGADITNETAGDISAPVSSDAGSDPANGDVFGEYQGASEEDFDLDSQEQEVIGDEGTQEDPGMQNAGGEAGAPAIDYSVAQRTLTVQLSDTVLDDLSEGADQLSYSAGRFWEAYYGHMPMESLDGGLYEETVAPGIEDARAPLAMEVSGMLPGNIRAAAEFIEYGSEEAFSEDALLSFALRFEDENGQPYTPESELSVVIGGHNLAAAMSEGQSLLVYDFREDPEREDPRTPGDYKASATVYRDFSEETGKSAEEIGKIRSRLFYLQPRANTDVLLYQDNRGLRVNRAAGTVSFPMQKASAKMIVTAVEPERTLTGTSWDGAAGFTVQGMFSADTAAELERHDSASADLTDYDGILAAAGAAGETGAFVVYDFAFISEEAGEYTPDRPVSAVIYDAAVGEQVMSGNPLTLYQFLEDGSCVPVAYAGFSADGVSFTADRLDTLVVAAPVTGNGAGLSGEDGTDLEDAGSLIEDDEPGSENFEDDLDGENFVDGVLDGENPGDDDPGNVTPGDNPGSEDQQIINEQTNAGVTGDILGEDGKPVIGDDDAIEELSGDEEVTEPAGVDVPVLESEGATETEKETDYPDGLIEDWTEEAAETVSEAAAVEEVTEEVTEKDTEKGTEETTEEVFEFVTEAAAENVTETMTEAETEQKQETETSTEAETEGATEAKLETEAETEGVTEAETESETEAETEAETEDATEVRTEAETEPETETEGVTEQTTEVMTEAITEAITESETESISEAETEAETEQSYPAQIFEGRVSGVSVLVDAPEGAFPEGTTMNVKRVLRGDVLSEIREAVAEDFVEVQRIQAVDISFFDQDNEEVEPLVPTSVVMAVTGIRDEQDAMVVHVNNEGAVDVQTSEMVGNSSGGTSLAFDAGGFSLYAIVVTETIETRYIDAQGNTYRIEVGYGEDAGIPAGAQLEVTELLEGTEAYEAYVQKTAEMLGKEVNHLAFAHAFDIKLVNPETGEHYQPTKPVAVSIELYKEDIQEGANVSVVHFPGSYAENPSAINGESVGTMGTYTEKPSEGEILKANINGEAVEFEASSFSIYVVTDEKPGVQYTFLDANGVEYVNRRQRLLAGETLIKPTAPSEDGKVFVKWVLVADPADQVSESNPEFTGWGPVSATEIPESGTVFKYLKAVFETTKQVHIRWYDQQENIIHQKTVLAGATVDPNEYGYTAAQTNSTEYLVFRYWTLDLFVLDTHGVPIRYTGGTADGDVNLYPYCAPAHWLHFDANKSDTDSNLPAYAPFSGPILVLEGEIPGQLPESHRTNVFSSVKGYTFAGWYNQPTGGMKIYNADGTLVSEDAFVSAFYTGGDSLEYDPTLYAHWTPAETARFSVAYYVQDPANAPGLTAEQKTYIFQVEDVEKEDENAVVGSTVSLSTIGLTASNAVTRLVSLAPSLEAAGLTLNTEKSADVTVRADGSTAFNVYFDRKVFTLSFYHGTTTRNVNPSITITELYGHDTSTEWPDNNYNPPTKQWRIFTDATNLSNTNTVMMPLMPAENRSYSDNGLATNYTYTRHAYVEKLDYNGALNTSEGYQEDNDKKDVRRFGQTNVSVQAGLLAKFEGLTLVRVEGAKNQNGYVNQRTVNYQWVKDSLDSPYKNTSISNANTTTLEGDDGAFRYYNPTGNASDYRVDAYYVRNRHTLKLHYILDGQEKNDVPAAYQEYMHGNAIVYDEIKYGTPLFGSNTVNTVYKGVTFPNGLVYDYDSDHLNVENEDNELDSWWFYDAALTIPVDVTTLTTMPDRDLELYEGMYTAYPVTIDPAGGVLDGKNGSTWFSVGVGENIAEYSVTRDYVLASELGQTVESGTGYFYVYNDDRQYSSPEFNVKPRTAVYVEAAEGETGEYVSYPGFWDFQYWYRVTATFDYVNKKFTVNEQPGDQNTPFEFSTAITGPVYLRAKWNRAGNYSVIYDAGEVRAPKDTRIYSDGADAVVKASVDMPAGYQFRFWSTEAQPTLGDISNPPDASICWRPNQSLRISRNLTPASQAGQTDKTITLHAWYETGALGENNRADYLFYIPDATTGTDVTWSDEPDDTPYYIQTLSPGETLVMPKTPEDPVTGRSGSFIGWFLDKDCTERFEGFGKIGAPENTKLYAGFAKLYTVTYMDAEDTAIVTVQTYIEGDTLDARPVEFAATSGYYVAFWSTVKNDDPASPTGTTVAYGGKGLSFAAGGYTTDLTFYPTLAIAHDLSFNSMGGSYVSPMEFPRKVGRWRPAPENPTRDGWIFDGWFTAPEGVTNDLSTTEGGIQYKFDMSLEDFKAGKVRNDQGTLETVAANALTDFPTVLYAHWHRDPSVTRYSTVTVNYWVQNVARNGYILYKSEVFNNPDNGGKGYAVGTTFTIPMTPTNKQVPAYGMAGYKTYVSEAVTGDDSAYFEISTSNHDGEDYLSTASTLSTEVLDDGAAQCNVYYNRKLYTLKFESDYSETVSETVYYRKGRVTGNVEYSTQDISYSVDGDVFSNPEDYQIIAWLGKDVGSVWPRHRDVGSDIVIVDVTHTNAEKPSDNMFYTYHFTDVSSWENSYFFNGWTEHHSTATGTVNNNYKEKMTVPSSVDKTLLPSASTTTYVLQAEYKANENTTSGVETTVRYFLVDANGNAIEQQNYRQTRYDITGSGTGANWSPDSASMDKILRDKAAIPAYHYNGTKTSKEESGERQVYTYYYRYKMPNNIDYEHYIARGFLGINIIDRQDDFVDLNLYAKGTMLSHSQSASQESSPVLEGDFTFAYRNNSNNRIYEHTIGETVWYHAWGNLSSRNTGMSTSALRAMIDVPITADPNNHGDSGEFTAAHPYKRIDWDYTNAHVQTVSATEYTVDLYYSPDNYNLLLYNGKYTDADGIVRTMSGGPAADADDPLQVMYTTYLTNNSGTQGYIFDEGLKADVPQGYEFAYWSTDIDAEIPFEGIMPERNLTLYAHYRVKQARVTAQGVDADGNVYRESEPDVTGRHTPITDANGVLMSWPTGADFIRSRDYGTRLQAYELPTPRLEPNEAFYGWKRLLSDGTLAQGYISSNTQIVQDTVVVPDIRYNKGGYVDYYANGGNYDVVDSSTDPATVTVTTPEDTTALYSDGGYYVGGSIKAKPGTSDGNAGSSRLYKTKTLDGQTYTLEFVCWNTAADGSGTDYYPADVLKIPDVGRMPLYAKYSDVRVLSLVYHLGNDYATADAFLAENAGDSIGTSTHNDETVVKVSFPEYTPGSVKYPNTEAKANRDNDDHPFKIEADSHLFIGWSTARDAFEPEVLDTDKIRLNTNVADEKNKPDENNIIHLYPVWAICKVVNDGVEHPFPTLNTAYNYIKANNLGAKSIEMLVDYSMPDDDRLVIEAGRNITLTTAKALSDKSAGDNITYYYNDASHAGTSDNPKHAIITRAENGGSLFANEGTFTLSNIILDGGNMLGSEKACSGNGGLVNSSAGTVNVRDGALLRRSKARNGGAVYASAGYLNIGAVSILDCYATGNGGAIYVASGVTAGEDGMVIDGHSNLALYKEGDPKPSGSETMTAEEADEANKAAATASTTGSNAVNGGGIYVASGGSFTFTSGELIKCRASGDGGAIYNAGTVSMEELQSNQQTTKELRGSIKYCSAVGDGGAIYNADGGTVDMEGGYIEYCMASGNGGGICNKSSVVQTGKVAVNLHSDGDHPGVISNCSAKNGGGIYDAAEGELDMAGGEIRYCTASEDGGGIYLAAGTMLLDELTNETSDLRGTIKFCTASRNGGGIYIAAGTTMTMNGGCIESCSATGNGGGIFNDGSFTMTNTDNQPGIIDGCYAKNGGGIYLGRISDDTSNTVIISITGGTIQNCCAVADSSNNGGNGGAICDNSKASIVLSGVTIDGHQDLTKVPATKKNARQGGGIYLPQLDRDYNSSLTITNCNLFNLTAEQGGTFYSNRRSLNPQTGVPESDPPVATTGCNISISGGNINGHTLAFAGETEQANAYNGGMLYLGNGSVDIKDTKIYNCTVSGDGNPRENFTAGSGGVIFNVGNGHPDNNGTGPTVAMEGVTIDGHYGGFRADTLNANNGGAIFMKMAILSLKNCTLRNLKVNAGTAGGGRGAAIFGYTNGGGNTPTEVTISGGSISGNTAGGTDGGAINVVSGKTVSSNGTRSSTVSFEGNVVVYGNTNAAGEQANMVLELDPLNGNNAVIQTTSTGLGTGARIGVYVVGTMTGTETEPYLNHGGFEDHFGTYRSDANLDAFINDRNGMYGEACPASDHGESKLIRWESYLCKLTDGNGRLLYQDEAHTKPAVYNYLKTQTDDASKVGGFNAAQGTLYTDAGSAVGTDTAVQLHMLRNYIQPGTDQPTLSGTRAVTFTTANNKVTDNPVSGDVYIYNTGDTTGWAEDDERRTKATITRKSDASAGSMFTVGTTGTNPAAGTLTTANLIFDGDLVSTTANGGIVNVTKGTLTVSDGTTMRNSKAVNGGAVYLAGTDAVMNMSVGTIAGNTATAAGAGIYIAESAKLKISGSPVFTSGSGADLKENKTGTGQNAGREDIYIAGYLGADASGDPKTAESLIVTGPMYSDVTQTAEQIKEGGGLIWVGAEQQQDEDNNHWDTLKQFAMFADDLTTGSGDNLTLNPAKISEPQMEMILAAFRNAATEDEYHGMSGESQPAGIQYIYWEGVQGSRRVVLRKVNDSHGALSGGEFTIWRGSKKVTGIDINGTSTDSFTSGSSGVFYTGMMDYGTYFIEETTPPSGYQKGWYYFILDGDHAMMSSVFTGPDAEAAAKAEAAEYNKAISLANQIINGKQPYDAATAGITDAMKDKVDEMLRYAGHGDKIHSGN